MLKEILRVKQQEGHPKRRWFSDGFFDLIIFIEESGEPAGFHLCYDKPSDERILSFDPATGYSHGSIKDGKEVGRETRKGTPIMVVGGVFDKERVLSLLKISCTEIDAFLANYVLNKIACYEGD